MLSLIARTSALYTNVQSELALNSVKLAEACWPFWQFSFLIVSLFSKKKYWRICVLLLAEGLREFFWKAVTMMSKIKAKGLNALETVVAMMELNSTSIMTRAPLTVAPVAIPPPTQLPFEKFTICWNIIYTDLRDATSACVCNFLAIFIRLWAQVAIVILSLNDSYYMNWS